MAAVSASGLALSACAGARPGSHVGREREEGSEGAEVTPGEDLMQEHGLLERILLLYAEAARRIERGEPLDPAVVSGAAALVARFVEDYHERLEEEFVFPRLASVRREIELVAVLRRQHERGRELTAEIARLSSRGPTPELALDLRAFDRMFRPHVAHEDTVLFPAFRGTMDDSEYRELGERFEEREHDRLGEEGFEGAVAEVARLEAALGLTDLAAFTA